jgi:hypothetical protein
VSSKVSAFAWKIAPSGLILYFKQILIIFSKASGVWIKWLGVTLILLLSHISITFLLLQNSF